MRPVRSSTLLILSSPLRFMIATWATATGMVKAYFAARSGFMISAVETMSYFPWSRPVRMPAKGVSSWSSWTPQAAMMRSEHVLVVADDLSILDELERRVGRLGADGDLAALP